MNTHSNGDHCWGNQLFPDAEIIGHRLCAAGVRQGEPGDAAGRARLRASSDDPRWPRSAASSPIGTSAASSSRPPTRSSTIGSSSTSTAWRSSFSTSGPAHTAGDVIVHLPQQRIVFTGDVLFRRCTPIGWEGTYDKWIAALDRIVALDPERRRARPWPAVRRRGAAEMKAYLEYVRSESRRFFDAGLPRSKPPSGSISARMRTGPSPSASGVQRRARLPRASRRAVRRTRSTPWRCSARCTNSNVPGASVPPGEDGSRDAVDFRSCVGRYRALWLELDAMKLLAFITGTCMLLGTFALTSLRRRLGDVLAGWGREPGRSLEPGTAELLEVDLDRASPNDRPDQEDPTGQGVWLHPTR